MTDLRKKALESCKSTVSAKFSETQQALSDLRESMAAESKSSAGDKHENARSRMQADEAQLQLQLDQHRGQLDEIDRLLNFVAGAGPASREEGGGEIVHGSLVETNK